MKEIKCPHCGEVISLDDKDYARVVTQISNAEFQSRIERRTKEIEQIVTSKLEKKHNDNINEYKVQIANLKKDLENVKNIAKNEIKLSNIDKEKEIAHLKDLIKSNEEKQKLEITNAIQNKEGIIADLKNQIIKNNSDFKEQLAKEKNAHEYDVKKLKDDIEKEKDYKTRLSTKMIGEDLEQHCSNEFNKIRSTAFPFAYFEKDNEVMAGSKGDFIYRDYADINKTQEYISVMIEVKNEDKDRKGPKQKNKEFFAKLDKDRTNKKCEYAILVTTLEAENELYDSIFQVYQYEKMYVVRPRFFIPLLSILKTNAQKNINNIAVIEQYKQGNADVEKFNEHWNAWKEGFKKNMHISNKKLEDAIKNIDILIDKLKKTRDELAGSQKQLINADNKVEDLTIKKLIKDSPSLKKQLEDNKNNNSI